jgi:hypothetical protein
MHEWHTSFLKVMQPLPKGTKTPEQLVAGDDMYLKFLMVGTNVKIVVSFAKMILTLICASFCRYAATVALKGSQLTDATVTPDRKTPKRPSPGKAAQRFSSTASTRFSSSRSTTASARCSRTARLSPACSARVLACPVSRATSQTSTTDTTRT